MLACKYLFQQCNQESRSTTLALGLSAEQLEWEELYDSGSEGGEYKNFDNKRLKSRYSPHRIFLSCCLGITGRP